MLERENERKSVAHTPVDRSQGGLSDISRSSAGSSSDLSDSEDEAEHLSHRSGIVSFESETTIRTALSPKEKRPRSGLPFGMGRLLWPNAQAKHAAEASELVNLATSAAPPPSATSPADGTDLVDVSGDTKGPDQSESIDEASTSSTPAELTAMRDLDDKILREALAELSNGGMFYSQEFDLTRCTQRRWQLLLEEKLATRAKGKAFDDSLIDPEGIPAIDLQKEEPSSRMPLAQRADRRFWWNRWLSKPLLAAGASGDKTVPKYLC